jgi:hypothetical protein
MTLNIHRLKDPSTKQNAKCAVSILLKGTYGKKIARKFASLVQEEKPKKL